MFVFAIRQQSWGFRLPPADILPGPGWGSMSSFLRSTKISLGFRLQLTLSNRLQQRITQFNIHRADVDMLSLVSVQADVAYKWR
jgi:hypothetical protein